MKLISSIQIEASPQKVWEIMNDPRLFSQWQKGYESTVQLKGEPGREGAKAQHVFLENGKKFTFEETVETSSPPAHITVTLDHPVMTYRIKTQLEESNAGTRVLIENLATMKAFSFKVLSPFLRKSFQKRQDEDLTRLKSLVESIDESSQGEI